MRFHRLAASDPGFHEVRFREGFNLVLADRTKEATKKDSRNGLGKSTFIDLVHFCLGKGVQKGQVPVVDDLSGWSFSLDLELLGAKVSLTRHVDEPRSIIVDGSFGSWPIQPSREEGEPTISAGDLRSVLGVDFFDLPAGEATRKYSPTLGSLLGYFSRRGKDAYSSPFEHHRKQAEWDKQVNVAYLLGLYWQDAAAWQELKDEKKALDQLKRAVASGVLPDYLGTEGALETERVRLAEEVANQQKRLSDFRVHEDYRQIENEADRLTEELHQLANANFSDRRSLELYEGASQEEGAATVTRDELEAVFSDANLLFPEAVTRRLDEAETFHRQVIANRQDYLRSEIERLRRQIAERDTQLEELDQQRSAAVAVLKTHGALDEFRELQGRVSETQASLSEVEGRIGRLREFNEARTKHADKVRQLESAARRRYEDLQQQRDEAIKLFNANTQALYEEPGRLVIDVSPTGFRFGVDIERARSTGVSNMKVFCFDVTLMQLWAQRVGPKPLFLIHDSLLYDGVDERQKALALDRAAREAEDLGWQYICTFNSDEFPSELPDGSPAAVEPVVRLTDATDDGMLLGRRFG